jgi:hypothetical protein
MIARRSSIAARIACAMAVSSGESPAAARAGGSGASTSPAGGGQRHVGERGVGLDPEQPANGPAVRIFQTSRRVARSMRLR